MITGIYKITSLSHPERIYIGSAVNIKKRWSLHRDDLRKDKHHSSKLQRHYNKYGEEDLVFSILLGCERADLVNTEQFHLDSLNPYFNICKVAYSSLGLKRSQETRNRVSRNHADVSGSKNPMYGRPQSPEHTMKVSLNHADISGEKNPMYGKHHTEETKEKIRQRAIERHKNKLFKV